MRKAVPLTCCCDCDCVYRLHWTWCWMRRQSPSYSVAAVARSWCGTGEEWLLWIIADLLIYNFYAYVWDDVEMLSNNSVRIYIYNKKLSASTKSVGFSLVNFVENSWKLEFSSIRKIC